MRALTIWQPWATLIALKIKRIENRPWRPPRSAMQEPILIHAGLSREGLKGNEGLTRYSGMPETLPFGALLGTARIVDSLTEEGACRLHRDQREWIIGPYCWVLKMETVFDEPIPWRGAQGLWNVDDAELARAREAGRDSANGAKAQNDGTEQALGGPRQAHGADLFGEPFGGETGTVRHG